MKEGFYYLSTIQNKEPCLVQVYRCADMGGDLAIGFNGHDGGGVIPLADLLPVSEFTPVLIEADSTHNQK